MAIIIAREGQRLSSIIRERMGDYTTANLQIVTWANPDWDGEGVLREGQRIVIPDAPETFPFNFLDPTPRPEAELRKALLDDPYRPLTLTGGQSMSILRGDFATNTEAVRDAVMTRVLTQVNLLWRRPLFGSESATALSRLANAATLEWFEQEVIRALDPDSEWYVYDRIEYRASEGDFRATIIVRIVENQTPVDVNIFDRITG